ncbi:hypothetical protein Trydic_g6563 [Trypoxylus dichotomus]
MSPTNVFLLICLQLSITAFQVKGEDLFDPNQRVIGGLIATPGQFPYQAYIRWYYYSYPPYIDHLICGGSVVHHRYILTAAQCVYDKYPPDIYVSVGSILVNNGWDISVNRIILRDPYFEPNGPMDIALLELSYWIDFTSTIRPISLFGGGFDPDVVNATGWGWPAFSGSVSAALQYVTLETTTNSICAESWGSKVTSDKICTRTSPGRSTCGRDMGGPLVFHGLLIGVIGWGDEDCDRTTPTVHTRVAPYLNWISNIISASSQKPGQVRIVGGFDAQNGQFPWAVSLRSSSSGRLFCGGSIINSRWILTAATCVDGSTTSEFYIAAGTLLLSSGGDLYRISKIVVHDSYNYPNYDIALVQVEGEIQFSNDVQPIEIETDNSNVEEVDCLLTGWGRKVYNGHVSEELQYVPLQTITNELCQAYWGSLYILDSEICTLVPDGGSGACVGDNGSALVCNGKAMGVYSRNYYFCGDRTPDVFSRVPHVAEWIEETISSGK